jgi:predicted aspartyl protease/Tfp pilus assembly protein PilF
MRSSSLRAVLGAVLLCAVVYSFSQESKPPENPDLAAANQQFQAGKFSEAIQKYQQALKAEPTLIPAQAGLIQAYLRTDQVDAAYDLAKSSLAANPSSAQLLAVMGSAQYRRAEIPESEASFKAAIKSDPSSVEAYLGLARVFRTALLYRRAYDQILRAHEIAPQNPEVQRAWFGMLPRRERIKALEAYLAGPHPDDPEENASLHSWLEYLKATVDQPTHACKLTSNVDKTETQLQMFLRDAKHVAGYGLLVKINDRNQRLLLDTGASGIVINRKAAEKAGLKRISSVQFHGIGDSGQRDAYVAQADQLRIGDLEFKDCIVTVSEKSMGLDEDGLIGADVFSSFIVDIDLPGDAFRLSPLPKRPEEATEAPATLASEAGSDSEDQPEEAGQAEKPTEKTSAEKSAAALPVPRIPKDRYVAPDMANWARIYRIGHDLLMPTHVNESKAMLFILDTGASLNMISTRAAATVSKVRSEDNLRIKGLSGDVNKVYTTDMAALQFANIRQPNQYMATIDMSRISKNLGIEVSGFIGFPVFRLVEMKIDYRDGLVRFVYDPDKLPAAWRR